MKVIAGEHQHQAGVEILPSQRNGVAHQEEIRRQRDGTAEINSAPSPSWPIPAGLVTNTSPIPP